MPIEFLHSIIKTPALYGRRINMSTKSNRKKKLVNLVIKSTGRRW